MFIGKWNKSVITTYLGLMFSILGIYLSFIGRTHYAFSCLIMAGICDMLDGTIARKCKRDESEKQFGIELDSLVDVISFLMFPIVIFFNEGLNKIYFVPLYILFATCGVARLAFFNITLEEENKNVPVKYYRGLPVTCSALVFPIMYLISLLLPASIYIIYMTVVMFIVSILYILDFKLRKPSPKIYPLIIFIGIIELVLFIGVL